MIEKKPLSLDGNNFSYEDTELKRFLFIFHLLKMKFAEHKRYVEECE